MDSIRPRAGLVGSFALRSIGLRSIALRSITLRRAVAVLLLLGASGAAATPTAAAPVAPGWSWPLSPDPAVVRPFDGPAAPWLPGHRGVDLRAGPGQAVLAPAAGRVVFAGTVVDRGVLTIEHPGGLRTSYEPVSAVVERGRSVDPGQRVAVLAPGPSHCPPATCLHWGLRRGTTYLDPLLLVGPRRPPVLLPWSGPATTLGPAMAVDRSGRSRAGPL